MTVRQAVVTAARVRLRPVLMTSLATIIGLLPWLKLGAGSESYAAGKGHWRHERVADDDGDYGSRRLFRGLPQRRTRGFPER